MKKQQRQDVKAQLPTLDTLSLKLLLMMKIKQLEKLNGDLLKKAQLLEDAASNIVEVDNIDGRIKTLQKLSAIVAIITENTVRIEKLKLENKQIENNNNNLFERLRKIAKDKL